MWLAQQMVIKAERIGAAAAKLFAEHGALLTIVGRNEKRLKDVARSCAAAAAKGHTPLYVIQDLTVEGGCENVVKSTVETYGKIDVLVNSAGKIAMTSLFDDNLVNFDELIAMKLRVPYKMTMLCTPHLKKTKGCIVNVFAAPMKTIPGFLAVTMIRGALEKFTEAGAVELASEGIRMNAVRPGITRTKIFSNINVPEDLINSTYEQITNHLLNKSIIEPEEVARMILFAASDVCPSLNASNLVVDGGSSIY
ncbi:enoyl-(Acyl carrier protein) reductase domain-containing protein [Phthorimaea operculella]|nr:enoyl-(Acyl carrier protein) reductase domain-containing protein [Phthorimaea operculella]